MGKGAILTVLINLQVPDYGCQQNNRRFHEKITLLLYPTSVQVQHNGISTFVSIANIGHKCWIYGIASVAFSGIVEVDDIKLGSNFVFITVFEQMIVCNGR